MCCLRVLLMRWKVRDTFDLPGRESVSVTIKGGRRGGMHTFLSSGIAVLRYAAGDRVDQCLAGADAGNRGGVAVVADGVCDEVVYAGALYLGVSAMWRCGHVGNAGEMCVIDGEGDGLRRGIG